MGTEPKSLKSIFMQALEKEALAERASFLNEACGGDAALRQRVDALLQANDRKDRLLDQPAVQHLAAVTMRPEAPEPQSQTQPDDSLDFLSPSQKPGSLGRLGHYDVIEVIGRGGMGVVLRAFDEKLHRVVALKVLAPALAGNGAARKRFVREAQSAAAVTHENVIAIHAVEDAGPVPYLVMQCIDGKTLQDKLAVTGPLELRTILRIGLQISEGLAAAHRQGLIHRDIKPANILLENGIERVKITDFGLARAVDDASLTQSGYIAGTPLYMSPEQSRGETVDHRTDLFSLGSLLYTLCVGHAAFRASNTMAVMKRVCEDTPRPIRELNPAIPAWLEAIVNRLLAKNPAERFASASEVANLLSRRLVQLQSGIEPSAIVPAARPASGNRRVLPWIALALLLAGTAGAAWYFTTNWPSDQGEAKGNAGVTPEAKPPVPVPKEDPKPAVLTKAQVLPPGHETGVVAVAFSPNGKTLASGGQDAVIVLWDTDSWKPRGKLKGHSAGDIAAIAFSPDGAKLASATTSNDDCCVRLWDVATAKAGRTLGPPWTGMWGVSWSPDGTAVACGGWGDVFRVLEVATGEDRHLIHKAAPKFLRGLSFSPKGDRIVTGGTGKTRVWDAKTGAEVPSEFPNTAMCPSFLYPGDAVAGWMFPSGRVVICDASTGELRKSWRAHPKTIEGLGVSPDGRFIASFGDDGVTKVWSTADYSEVATLLGHKGVIYSAAFSPDGTRLATAGRDDGTIRVWDLPPVCRVRK